MGSLSISPQLIGIALAIVGAAFFLVFVYAIVAYQISLLRAKRREKKLSEKFFNDVEGYRDDFS